MTYSLTVKHRHQGILLPLKDAFLLVHPCFLPQLQLCMALSLIVRSLPPLKLHLVKQIEYTMDFLNEYAYIEAGPFNTDTCLWARHCPYTYYGQLKLCLTPE